MRIFANWLRTLTQREDGKGGIGFKIKILDALSVVNVRRVRLPPSGLSKIFILKPIVRLEDAPGRIKRSLLLPCFAQLMILDKALTW